MLQIECDFRWQKAWTLLSLDDAEPFFEEMWVPCQAKVLAEGLRSVLRKWENDHDYFLSNPSEVSYQCFRWFSDHFTESNLQMLIRWVDGVFHGQGGSERIEEWWWCHMSYTIDQHSSATQDIDPRVIDWLLRVGEGHRMIWSKAKERIDLQFQSPISEWGRIVEYLNESERNDVRVLIKSIVRRNVFAYVWQRQLSQLKCGDLDELFVLGNRLTSETEKERGGMGYPGLWRFYLLPFIRNAPAMWGGAGDSLSP